MAECEAYRHNVAMVDLTGFRQDFSVELGLTLFSNTIHVKVAGNRRAVRAVTVKEHHLGSGTQLIFLDTPDAEFGGPCTDVRVESSFARVNGTAAQLRFVVPRFMTVSY